MVHCLAIRTIDTIRCISCQIVVRECSALTGGVIISRNASAETPNISLKVDPLSGPFFGPQKRNRESRTLLYVLLSLFRFWGPKNGPENGSTTQIRKTKQMNMRFPTEKDTQGTKLDPESNPSMCVCSYGRLRMCVKPNSPKKSPADPPYRASPSQLCSTNQHMCVRLEHSGRGGAWEPLSSGHPINVQG